jgi:hypothetical protein
MIEIAQSEQAVPLPEKMVALATRQARNDERRGSFLDCFQFQCDGQIGDLPGLTEM